MGITLVGWFQQVNLNERGKRGDLTLDRWVSRWGLHIHCKEMAELSKVIDHPLLAMRIVLARVIVIAIQPSTPNASRYAVVVRRFLE